MPVRVYVYLCCCLVVVAAGCGAQTESPRQSVATTPPVTASTPQQPSGVPQTLTPAVEPPGGVVVERAADERQNARPETTASKKLDPCSLLTAADIEEARGETLSNQMSSERVSGAFLVAQCYYAVASLSNSVNLALKSEAPNSAGKNAVKDFWQRFRDAKDNKKSDAPEPVPGIGDEAYWEGGSKFGILHVRRGDAYILSISIGGKGAPDEKRKKSIALAAKALKRLPS